MVEDYAKACFATWATSTVRTLAIRSYMHDKITPTRACRIAEAKERAYHQADPASRGMARRHLTHALARWCAALIRTTDESATKIEAPVVARNHLPIVLQSDIDRANALAARRRFVKELAMKRDRAREWAIRRSEASARCDKALLDYRRAKYQHERAIMKARDERGPDARSERSWSVAVKVAKAQLDRARKERDQVRRQARNAYTAIRILKHRFKTQNPLDSMYLLEV